MLFFLCALTDGRGIGWSIAQRTTRNNLNDIHITQTNIIQHKCSLIRVGRVKCSGIVIDDCDEVVGDERWAFWLTFMHSKESTQSNEYPPCLGIYTYRLYLHSPLYGNLTAADNFELHVLYSRSYMYKVVNMCILQECATLYVYTLFLTLKWEAECFTWFSCSPCHVHCCYGNSVNGIC